MSQLLADLGPSLDHAIYDYRSDDDNNPFINNSHITGLAMGASGICGQPIDIRHVDCTDCERSTTTLKKEITLSFLEKATSQENLIPRNLGKQTFSNTQ